MEFIFLSIFDFFQKRKILLYTLFVSLFLLVGYGAMRIKVEEDISKFFPKDKKLEKVNQVFQGSKFAEKLVVIVSLKDTLKSDPETLIRFGDSLVSNIQTKLQPYIKGITYRVDEEAALQILDLINQHLPVFLNDKDFSKLDSITNPETINITLDKNYQQLVSPAGLALKKMILQDPLGISKIVLKKMQALQYDSDFELYDNCFLSKDHKNLVFFISPAFPPNDTGHNSKFLEEFDEVIDGVAKNENAATAAYFGSLAVAVGNANQLHDDTVLTVSIMIGLMIIFLFGFLRKKSAPIYILIPVLFGGLFSLALINVIQGSISVLAIAAGSIVLGIAINYSLHFLSHLKETGNVRQVVKDLAHPLTLGGVTTILAFLSLQFAKASMLSDLGLFAGLSLIGAILCSLVFLPHLLKDNFFVSNSQHKPWKVKLFFFDSTYSKYLIAIILIGTPLMLYFAQDVKFNSDMNKLNFMAPKLEESQAKLNKIASFATKSVYLVADGENLEQALRRNEQVAPLIDSLKRQGVVKKYNSVSSFIISDSLQKIRLTKWNSYWTEQKKEEVRQAVHQKFEALKFSKLARANFDSLINKRFSVVNDSARKILLSGFFGDYITEKKGLTTVVALVSVEKDHVDSFYKRFEKKNRTEPFDRRLLTNLFVSSVNADFTFIVTTTSIIVFMILLISYGRIELTLITFIPMLITWIWILGVMSLVGIEFNIVNVMISTFIFGLGDDYSIFIMDGLQKEYKSGHRHLDSIQDSIFLSAITTICGLGVLIFAKHPALQSVAAISVIGIVAVFIISQTIEPFLFSLLVAKRVEKKYPPAVFFGIISTLFIYFLFVVGCLVLTVVGLVMFKILRLNFAPTRAFYHRMLQLFSAVSIYAGVFTPKKIINAKGQYDQPKVIISNHQSFIDILVSAMVHPKVLLVTNSWVWNSPLFGWVVKMADYYPVDGGAEGGIEKLKARVTEGYSIMIFPEGTRSADGHMKRFHKGAFYLAEQLDVDVLPLVLHGNGDAIRKGDLYRETSSLTMKYLPAISRNDARFGTTYAERTKSIGRYFKQEYAQLCLELETPKYFRHKLISNYIYKGPVLEWYLRVKLRMENYYQGFHELIPRNASVLDLGCGYGFLDYVLHFTAPERKIIGVDYDEEKIEVAANGYLRGENLSFVHADVTKHPIGNPDVIIIADVLHYLDRESQDNLLKKCFDNLAAGGFMIVRDGDADLQKAHKMTKLTELFSIKLLNFNKSEQPLNFISGKRLKEFTEQHGMDLQNIDNQKLTSNRIFVIRKKTT